MGLNFGTVKKERQLEEGEYGANYQNNQSIGDSATKLAGSKAGKNHQMNRFSSNLITNNGNSMAYGNDSMSIFSGGKSNMTMGGGMANRISSALSRVVWNKNNNMNADDDEIAELLQNIEELNSAKDLAVKLNSQSKLCKILENDDFFFS